MSLQERLLAAMKEGMVSRNAVQLSVVRLLRSAIKNKEIDKRASLTEEEVLQVIVSAVKQRRESIEQFSRGGRQDLVDQETGELAILQSFLPTALSDAEIDLKITQAVVEAGATDVKQMGQVMKILTPQVVGRVEGAVLSQKVRAYLMRRAGG